MRHADLRREATAVIAKPASSPCMILCCVVLGVGVWAYGCVFGGGMSMRWVTKTRVKPFRLSFSTGFPSRKT